MAASEDPSAPGDYTDIAQEDDPPAPDEGGGFTGSSDGAPYTGVGDIGENPSSEADDPNEVVGFVVDWDVAADVVNTVLQIAGSAAAGGGFSSSLIPTIQSDILGGMSQGTEY